MPKEEPKEDIKVYRRFAPEAFDLVSSVASLAPKKKIAVIAVSPLSLCRRMYNVVVDR